MRRCSRRLLCHPVTVVTLAVALASGLGGCGEDFDPFNRLTSLRVLAIKADPPSPGPGETTTLSALVYTPPSLMGDAAAAAVTFQWSWCPFPGSANEGYPCAVSEAELQSMAMQAGIAVPAYDLGPGPTAMLPHSLNPLLLQQICAGVEGLPQTIDCEGGFPAQVKLVVRAGGDEVVTVRTLRLRFGTSEPNANPRIDGLTISLPDMVVDLPIGETPEVTIPRAEASLLKAAVPLDMVAERYTGKDENMQVAMLREQLTLTWFVESGDTDEERTRWVEGGYQAEKTFENEWTPDRVKDYARDTSKVIVVIRDNRGGVDWRGAAVRLEAAP
jgi:hypothetical protein